jgi:hypothetical protein
VYFACFAVPAPAATFTTNALVTEADTSHNGPDFVLSGAAVATAGPHAFIFPA